MAIHKTGLADSADFAAAERRISGSDWGLNEGGQRVSERTDVAMSGGPAEAGWIGDQLGLNPGLVRTPA
jgi:hypothetical protein